MTREDVLVAEAATAAADILAAIGVDPVDLRHRPSERAGLAALAVCLTPEQQAGVVRLVRLATDREMVRCAP